MKKSRLIQKLSSIMLVSVMLVTILSTFGMTSSYAAMSQNGDDFNWWIHNNSSTHANWTFSVETIDGSTALKVVNSTAAASGSMQIMNPYAFANMPVGKKWKVVFDMKEITAADASSTVNFSMNHSSALSNISKTAVEGRDGWYTYSAVSSSNVNKSNQPGLYFNISAKSVCEFYIDNVHLYILGEDGETADTSIDYIEDGDFESGKTYGYGNPYPMRGHTFVVSGWSALGGYGAKYDAATMNIENVLDEGNARTGNGSLRIIRKGARYILAAPTIRLQTEDTFAAGTYTLSFYVKGTMSSATQTSATTSSGLNWWLGNVTQNMGYSANWTVSEDTEHPGWTRYETSITSTTENVLRFNISDEFDGYLDDVSLKNSEGAEMLTNGSFDIILPDPADYEPQNPFIISSLKTGGVNNISWRNPVKETLSKVSMYKHENGEWSLVSDQYSSEAGKVFEEYDANLNAGTVYTYKLRFDFSDGESREVILSKDPKAVGYTDRKAGNSWGVTDRSADISNQYFLPNNVTIDTTEKANGTASLHMFTNKAYNAANRPADVTNWSVAYFSRLQQSLSTTEKGKYYRLSYKIKVNNATKIQVTSAQAIIGAGARNTSDYPYSTGSTDGWTEKSMELYCDGSGAAAGPFQWYIGSDDVQDLWIDDITLYELTGKDGTVVENAVNHITDGGFEDYTAAAAITDEKATASNKSVAISWTAPADSRYIRVYEVTEDGDMLRAVCEPSAGGVTIENLINNKNYTFKLQSQNMNGVLSDTVTVSGTPAPPPYEIESDYSLKLGSTPVSAVTGSGAYSVSLDITNYTESSFAPALIAALYKDDILVQYNKSDSVIAADEETKTLTVNLSISDYDAESTYKICAFFWNDFDKMNPLYKSVSWDNK